MKLFNIITFTILAITLQLSVFAQETPLGKKTYDDFWKALEGNNFNAAKTKLDSLKRREPNFDTSKMETALNDALNKRNNSVAASKAALYSSIDQGANLKALFMNRNTQLSNSLSQEELKSIVADFAKKTDEVLAVDRRIIARDLETNLGYVKKEFEGDAAENAGLIKHVNGALKPQQAEIAYNELLLRQAYWDNARKIYPEETDFAKAYDSITASINKLGTPDERAVSAEKNAKNLIDSRKFPEARVKDANLEKLLQNAFINQVQTRKEPFTFLKAVVTSTDYVLVRHDISGVILGRYRIGAIGYKNADGTCHYTEYKITQDYFGSSFSGSWRGSYTGSSAEMRCENIK